MIGTAGLRHYVGMSKARVTRSGPGRPAGVDSLETRQRVIDAACRCFAQNGYGPATNTLIAEVAGVTAGSVYYHFGTKHKLFESVCDDVYGQIVTRSVQAMAGPHSVPGLLRAVLIEAMRINHESPELAAFVASAPVDARRHPELAPAFEKQAAVMTEALTHAVTVGQSGGRISADLDAAQIAVMISAVLDGFAHAAVVHDAAEMDRMVRQFDELILGPAGAD